MAKKWRVGHAFLEKEDLSKPVETLKFKEMNFGEHQNDGDLPLYINTAISGPGDSGVFHCFRIELVEE